MPSPMLPSTPGAYALALRLERPVGLRVGALGVWDFPEGVYVYLGSARGPGGIRARLGRHLRGASTPPGTGRPRWHVDYLRAMAQPIAWGYTVAPAPGLPWECLWSQRLAAAPRAWVPVPGFGASDCRHRCPAHLIAFPPDAELLAWLRERSKTWGLTWHTMTD
ncbi:MAG TPA: GIY-YIG nuclease family protein [Anaerolineae bacterium]|nr:GIY-YIG nuclease family protein [Anaerolineae bacterium]HID85457.1 GIY-YIG nuclease family protein [Anaerolineales bacterium]